MAMSAGVSEHIHLNMGWDWRYTAWQVKEPKTLANDTLSYCLEILHRQLKYHTFKFGGNNIFPILWFNERVKGGRTVLFWCKRSPSYDQWRCWQWHNTAQFFPSTALKSTRRMTGKVLQDHGGTPLPCLQTAAPPKILNRTESQQNNGVATIRQCSKPHPRCHLQWRGAMACPLSVCYRHCSGLGTRYQESRLHFPCF